jgi:hypothetical protein
MTKHGESSAYYVNMSSYENLCRLFNYFYDDVDESMYLTRKYNLFEQGVRRIDSDVIASHETNKKDPKEVSAFPVDESEEKVDLKEYFPNLSSGEQIRLFGEEWLRKHTRYKK